MKEMPNKGEYVRFKNYEEEMKSLFVIYANFGSISVAENNGKQNPDESYSKKYQKQVACSYSYKSVCFDDLILLINTQVKTAVYNFVNSMLEKSKYCSDVMENILTKNI